MNESQQTCEHPADQQEVDFSSGILVKVTCHLCGHVGLFD